MSRTKIVALGPNSWSVNYSAGTTVVEIFALVKQACFNGGWEVYDAESTTSCVFRAPMADSPVVYKYVRLVLETATLLLSVYESWNIATHTGINEAYNASPVECRQPVYLVSGGAIMLFVNPRWLVALARIPEGTGKYVYGSAAYNTWVGCLEIMKENSGEVTGQFPRYALVNGYGIGGGDREEIDLYHEWSLPRSKNGAVGKNASRACVISNPAIPFANRGNDYDTTYCGGASSYTTSVSVTESVKWATAFPNTRSPLGPSRSPLALTPYAYDLVTGIRGAFYGVKLLGAPDGLTLDTVSLMVSSTYKLSAFGTQVPHVLLRSTSTLGGASATLFPL